MTMTLGTSNGFGTAGIQKSIEMFTASAISSVTKRIIYDSNYAAGIFAIAEASLTSLIVNVKQLVADDALAKGFGKTHSVYFDINNKFNVTPIDKQNFTATYILTISPGF
jgi:hypothetical protein